jgi:hypothetical protein
LTAERRWAFGSVAVDPDRAVSRLAERSVRAYVAGSNVTAVRWTTAVARRSQNNALAVGFSSYKDQRSLGGRSVPRGTTDDGNFIDTIRDGGPFRIRW